MRHIARASRTRWILVPLLALGLLATPVHADDDDSEQIPNEILVDLEAGADPVALGERFGLELREELPEFDLYVYFDPLGRDEDDLADALEEDPAVDDAEGHKLFDNPEGGQRTVPELSRTATLDDMGTQPAFGGIGGPAAISRHDGGGVVVALLDTGLSLRHPATRSALTTRSLDIVSGAPRAAAQPNGLDDDGDGSVDESLHHATFVAGVLGLTAPGARILPIRVLDADGRGTSFDLARGILAAIRRGADVINLSLGMLHESTVLDEAVQRALNEGIVVVAAAGNRALDRPDFPATYPGVVSVSAVDDAFSKAAFSSFGEPVDLTAPGVSVLSAYGDEDFARWSGTSFSTPFVSGAVALLIQRYPGLRPFEVTQLLKQTAQPDAAGGYAGLLGAGVLDAAALTGVVTGDATSLSLARSAGETQLRWSPVSGLASFDLVRGDVRGLAYGPVGDVALGAVTCIRDDLPSDPLSITATDAVLPAPGEAYFYVLRDRKDATATGYGVASAGGARYPSSGDCSDAN